ncbi:Uncharacterised protein [Bordetella pertussis]|nr:Uncharacterised protein [Bordetella pertussis]CFM07075.1 Uncharacterised protein [Bordetella pertussis]CFM18478.1 Uncharacterised protein [Bordetella pertussis]CFM36792.1 Uncharacterised protein [Bordetella pertussis]CFM42107.1 Uncharacterised protein [Bordetella pertussis]
MWCSRRATEAPHEPRAARPRRHRRHRQYPPLAGARAHAVRPAAGGGRPGPGRLRPGHGAGRRPVLRHVHLGPAGAQRGRAAGHPAAPCRRHHGGRRVVPVPPAGGHGGAGDRAVRGGADLLWLQPAHRRRQAGLDAGPAAVRGAVPAALPHVQLCAGRGAPYAPVRHHARTAGRRGGGRAPVGAAQPARLRARPAEPRRRAGRAHDQRSVDQGRQLPGDRRRRRAGAGARRTRGRSAAPAGVCAGHRRGREPSADFGHARPDRHLRGGVGPARVRDGRRGAARHGPCDAVRRLHHQHAAVPGGPGLLRQGRGRRVRRERRDRAGRQPAGQHQWRRPVVQPSGHVRAVHRHRVGGAAARRVRRAPGRGRMPTAACCRARPP